MGSMNPPASQMGRTTDTAAISAAHTTEVKPAGAQLSEEFLSLQMENQRLAQLQGRPSDVAYKRAYEELSPELRQKYAEAEQRWRGGELQMNWRQRMTPEAIQSIEENPLAKARYDFQENLWKQILGAGYGSTPFGGGGSLVKAPETIGGGDIPARGVYTPTRYAPTHKDSSGRWSGGEKIEAPISTSPLLETTLKDIQALTKSRPIMYRTSGTDEQMERTVGSAQAGQRMRAETFMGKGIGALGSFLEAEARDKALQDIGRQATTKFNEFLRPYEEEQAKAYAQAEKEMYAQREEEQYTATRQYQRGVDELLKTLPSELIPSDIGALVQNLSATKGSVGASLAGAYSEGEIASLTGKLGGSEGFLNVMGAVQGHAVPVSGTPGYLSTLSKVVGGVPLSEKLGLPSFAAQGYVPTLTSAELSARTDGRNVYVERPDLIKNYSPEQIAKITPTKTGWDTRTADLMKFGADLEALKQTPAGRARFEARQAGAERMSAVEAVRAGIAQRGYSTDEERRAYLRAEMKDLQKMGALSGIPEHRFFTEPTKQMKEFGISSIGVVPASLAKGTRAPRDTRAEDRLAFETALAGRVAASPYLQQRTRAHIANDIRNEAMLSHQVAVQDFEKYRSEHKTDLRSTPDPVATALFDRVEQTRKTYLASEQLENMEMAGYGGAKFLLPQTEQARDYGISSENARSILEASGSPKITALLGKYGQVGGGRPVEQAVSQMSEIPSVFGGQKKTLADKLGLPSFGAQGWNADQSLKPTSYGETATGEWVPLTPTGKVDVSKVVGVAPEPSGSFVGTLLGFTAEKYAPKVSSQEQVVQSDLANLQRYTDMGWIQGDKFVGSAGSDYGKQLGVVQSKESNLAKWDKYISGGKFTGTESQYNQYMKDYSDYMSSYNVLDKMGANAEKEYSIYKQDFSKYEQDNANLTAMIGTLEGLQKQSLTGRAEGGISWISSMPLMGGQSVLGGKITGEKPPTMGEVGAFADTSLQRIHAFSSTPRTEMGEIKGISQRWVEGSGFSQGTKDFLNKPIFTSETKFGVSGILPMTLVGLASLPSFGAHLITEPRKTITSIPGSMLSSFSRDPVGTVGSMYLSGKVLQYGAGKVPYRVGYETDVFGSAELPKKVPTSRYTGDIGDTSLLEIGGKPQGAVKSTAIGLRTSEGGYTTFKPAYSWTRATPEVPRAIPDVGITFERLPGYEQMPTGILRGQRGMPDYTLGELIPGEKMTGGGMSAYGTKVVEKALTKEGDLEAAGHIQAAREVSRAAVKTPLSEPQIEQVFRRLIEQKGIPNADLVAKDLVDLFKREKAPIYGSTAQKAYGEQRGEQGILGRDPGDIDVHHQNQAWMAEQIRDTINRRAGGEYTTVDPGGIQVKLKSDPNVKVAEVPRPDEGGQGTLGTEEYFGWGMKPIKTGRSAEKVPLVSEWEQLSRKGSGATWTVVKEPTRMESPWGDIVSRVLPEHSGRVKDIGDVFSGGMSVRTAYVGAGKTNLATKMESATEQFVKGYGEDFATNIRKAYEQGQLSQAKTMLFKPTKTSSLPSTSFLAGLSRSGGYPSSVFRPSSLSSSLSRYSRTSLPSTQASLSRASKSRASSPKSSSLSRYSRITSSISSPVSSPPSSPISSPPSSPPSSPISSPPSSISSSYISSSVSSPPSSSSIYRYSPSRYSSGYYYQAYGFPPMPFGGLGGGGGQRGGVRVGYRELRHPIASGRQLITGQGIFPGILKPLQGRTPTINTGRIISGAGWKGLSGVGLGKKGKIGVGFTKSDFKKLKFNF